VSFLADVMVASPNGRPLVIVELRNRAGLTRDLAASIRRNLVEDYGLAETPDVSFLLVSQERGFLWTTAGAGPEALPPHEFGMAEVVERYLPNLPPDYWLREHELELVVVQWLQDLIDGTAELHTAAGRAIADSGLFDSLGGARVIEEVRV